MIDNLFTAALAFTVLVCGTLAIGSAFEGAHSTTAHAMTTPDRVAASGPAKPAAWAATEAAAALPTLR